MFFLFLFSSDWKQPEGNHILHKVLGSIHCPYCSSAKCWNI